VVKSGYCLIQTKPNQANTVCDQLLALPEVKSIITTTGMFDLLASVEFENNRELQRFLLNVRGSASIEFVSFFQITNMFVPDHVLEQMHAHRQGNGSA